MQRFGFRAAHLQITIACRRLTGKSLWLVVPSGVSATHVTQRSTQASGAVPTLLCNWALKAQEESCPRRLKCELAEPPGC